MLCTVTKTVVACLHHVVELSWFPTRPCAALEARLGGWTAASVFSCYFNPWPLFSLVLRLIQHESWLFLAPADEAATSTCFSSSFQILNTVAQKRHLGQSLQALTAFWCGCESLLCNTAGSALPRLHYPLTPSHSHSSLNVSFSLHVLVAFSNISVCFLSCILPHVPPFPSLSPRSLLVFMLLSLCPSPAAPRPPLTGRRTDTDNTAATCCFGNTLQQAKRSPLQPFFSHDLRMRSSSGSKSVWIEQNGGFGSNSCLFVGGIRITCYFKHLLISPAHWQTQCAPISQSIMITESQKGKHWLSCYKRWGGGRRDEHSVLEVVESRKKKPTSVSFWGTRAKIWCLNSWVIAAPALQLSRGRSQPAAARTYRQQGHRCMWGAKNGLCRSKKLPLVWAERCRNTCCIWDCAATDRSENSTGERHYRSCTSHRRTEKTE